MTKKERSVKLKFALLRIRHYLTDNGCPVMGLKKRKLVEIFADMRYSENGIVDIDSWILEKAEYVEFSKLKTGRKIISTKRDKEVPVIVKMNYAKFINSSYWRYVRNLVLIRDGNKCTKCNGTTRLEAHHLTYKNHYNEHKHLEDLITLCRSCHKEEHKRLNKKKESIVMKYNIITK